VETALASPTQASAPDLARRVGIVIATLRTVIGRGFAGKPHLIPLGAPLWNRLSRILKRFQDLMDRLAAGRLPQPRRGPHTGGAPHPENLQRGNPLPTNCGWLLIALGWEAAGCGAQLEHVLAEPAAAEILALIPAAGRILRPLRRMLGLGPYDPNRHPRNGGRKSAGPRQPRPCVAKAAPSSADATIPASALSAGVQQPRPPTPSRSAG
jgi:hypothetical protein